MVVKTTMQTYTGHTQTYAQERSVHTSASNLIECALNVGQPCAQTLLTMSKCLPDTDNTTWVVSILFTRADTFDKKTILKSVHIHCNLWTLAENVIFCNLKPHLTPIPKHGLKLCLRQWL